MHIGVGRRGLLLRGGSSSTSPTWLRSALALSTGSGASVTWFTLREAEFPPVARLEAAVSALRLTSEGVVGPRGAQRHIGSHALHVAVTAASVRCVLGPASLPLVGSIAALSLVVPVLTPAALLNYAVESSVTVSTADARTIRTRLQALQRAGVTFTGHAEVDAALCRKLSKALWLAAAGVRSADGDASFVSRASLREAADAALPDPLSLTIGDVRLNGRDANSLATAVFDLYDVNADGKLSYGAAFRPCVRGCMHHHPALRTPKATAS